MQKNQLAQFINGNTMTSPKHIRVNEVLRDARLNEIATVDSGWNINFIVGISVSSFNDDYSYIYLLAGPECVEVAEGSESLLDRIEELRTDEIIFN